MSSSLPPLLYRVRVADSELLRLISENNTCSVCLSSFESGDVLKVLPCKHFFHKACLDPWFHKAGACPICRQSLASPTSMTLSEGYIQSEFVKSIRRIFECFSFVGIQKCLTRFWRVIIFLVILSFPLILFPDCSNKQRTVHPLPQREFR